MLTRFLSSGFALMVLAAFVYAISDITLKYLTSSLPITEISFIRFFLGGIILWPALSYQRISLKGNRLRFLILRGIVGTLSFFCILKSMALIPLSLTMVLFYTFPIFVAFFFLVALAAAAMATTEPMPAITTMMNQGCSNIVPVPLAAVIVTITLEAWP